MGLVLVYNAVGLMSNNVSLHEKLHYVQAVLFTFVLTVYSIQGEVVHAVQFVYHSPSICRR